MSEDRDRDRDRVKRALIESMKYVNKDRIIWRHSSTGEGITGPGMLHLLTNGDPLADDFVDTLVGAALRTVRVLARNDPTLPKQYPEVGEHILIINNDPVACFSNVTSYTEGDNIIVDLYNGGSSRTLHSYVGCKGHTMRVRHMDAHRGMLDVVLTDPEIICYAIRMRRGKEQVTIRLLASQRESHPTPKGKKER